MAKKRLQNFQAPPIIATALSAALMLTGCNNAEDEPDDSAAENQQLTNIGISLAAPGLISGIDPANVSGVEVDLVVDLSKQMDVISDSEEVSWVPAENSQVADQLETGELDLVIGQITAVNLEDDIAWVGPYISVEAGLLVRSGTSPENESSQDYIAHGAVGSLDDLEDAAVCVVAGSLADGAQIPADEHTKQQTVSACETGMRSGRYDAIAADDVQLAGLLESSSTPEAYEMLLWSDLAADGDEDIPEQLQTSGGYWMGTTPEQCEATAAALKQLISDGVVRELFSQWDETLDYVPGLIEADDVTTRHCSD
ncbi:MAG: transporter substrate-binding domain-containing protein [Yaniella sp.]|uniref:substrate-binding periplasmic protein n=1 Tax=Yaniella sp. TaxID=2773929 RepID=UPI0026494344|nr:transporter substrate-binding domain-containing protein [Yaniella sp.]MDN5731524.1 transporter substrate-binding domain-containing protein [Yaniella sp.]MDN5816004.1 transporter substrate-binding domain-containing protein [Yaniella sp.]MDN5818054.1 transporter substrate-binding domain-containing protein [Yaniella sp.]MDN5837607.1 transporter substrate-binding domain-containing protein [Yaniella sp.]MDN5889253.1 transporter substrate-binding domain-containing protein [Yaniella sp.]